MNPSDNGIDGEPTRLKRYERRVEWPLAAVALLFLAIYSVEVLAQPHGVARTVLEAAALATYGVFALDYLWRLFLAQPRLKWFLRHLFDLLIIALPFLRPLRLLSLAVVIRTLQRAIGHTVRSTVILYTAFGAAVIVYGSSLAILDAERNSPCTSTMRLAGDCSKITNFGDALWWSFTTVTTVGYGDTVPKSVEGRFVAVALMVAGVSLLGVVTATLASWIVERVAQEDTASKAATAAQIDELRDEIRKLAEAVRDPAYGEGRRGHVDQD
jgi:voltage-gated potassium channel